MASTHDQQQNLSNQIRLGSVVALDLDANRCRVRTGEIVTDFLPWLVPRAGAAIEWSAPSVGEQVVVLSPEGDTLAGLVLRGLYSDAFSAPSRNPDVHLVRFADAAEIVYDSASHRLQAILPRGGTATITADGGVVINGPLTVNGNSQINGEVNVAGTVTAKQDVIGAGVSLKGHVHSGVKSGGDMSAGPQ